MMALRFRLGNMLGVGIIVQVCAVVQSVGIIDLHTDWSHIARQALDTGGLALIGTPIIVFFYAIFPLGSFELFARFDQLEDADSGETDTDGLRFGDAAEVTGYPMPHY